MPGFAAAAVIVARCARLVRPIERPSMNMRVKLLLVAVVPLLLAFALTAWVLHRQQTDLSLHQQDLVRGAYTETTRSELRHYVALALSTVSPLFNTGRDDDDVKRLAMQQLVNLDYGPDGYFFLYDYSGRSLMHPRMPELVGQQLIDLRDSRGQPVIRMMIDKARAGGGFVEYTWSKPSTQQQTPKLAYVTGLDRWGWMIGTGTYTDDVDRIVKQLDDQLAVSVETTQRRVAAAAVLSLALVLASVLGLSITELRAADAKLTLLARRLVRSQEDERAWLSRELHDSTSQTLVSAKLLTESALDRLPAHDDTVRPVLQRALARLSQALDGVRGISHRLRPDELDSLGLATALRRLGEDSCAAAGIGFDFEAGGEQAPDLPDEVRTTLFRVAQEALTDVLKHARPRHVHIGLDSSAAGLMLTIADDGCGFDPDAVAQHPKRGIGLRNMRERLVDVGGSFEVRSGHGGTRIVAHVPRQVVQRLATVT
jgi:two-component system NarL family sensor kinase